MIPKNKESYLYEKRTKKTCKSYNNLNICDFYAIACTLLYFTIPYFYKFNGPDTINTEFDRQVSGGFYYYQQILLVSISVISLVSLNFICFIKRY